MISILMYNIQEWIDNTRNGMTLVEDNIFCIIFCIILFFIAKYFYTFIFSGMAWAVNKYNKDEEEAHKRGEGFCPLSYIPRNRPYSDFVLFGLWLFYVDISGDFVYLRQYIKAIWLWTKWFISIEAIIYLIKRFTKEE